jgi:DNA-binding NtrC family response regulator
MEGVPDHVMPLLGVEDEDVARRSSATLLISASTQQGVETLARRVHSSGPRAHFPFVHVWAGGLPVERDVLKTYCTSVRFAAAGGTMLISAVEEMPSAVQDTLIELLAGPESAAGASGEVRLISGTTVSLLDRVAAGAFSGRLFYRLNIIHVSGGDDRAGVEHP